MVRNMEENNTMRAAQRLFALMETLALQGTMGVTELAAATQLNKATVFRLLNTLAALGYVRQEESGKYRLTYKLLGIAGRLLEQNDFQMMVRPYLERLAARTGETVHLVQREDDHIIYIDKVEPTVNSIRMVSRVGMSQPLYCTAVGKALLAGDSRREAHEIWNRSRVRVLTPHTIVRWEDFEAELQQICRVGYATDMEENELGVRCVAVSLPDFSGRCRYAVSISAPVSRMTTERLPQIAAQLLEFRSEFKDEWKSGPL
ncbi:MAG: IclR family transcriptional regulator [Firmicutes bacterium]|nr:IclR family transcriptional regulator [Bacillota bacterium]